MFNKFSNKLNNDVIRAYQLSKEVSYISLRWSRIYLQCRRSGFNPWVGKTPWRREWLSTPVFLPGEYHGKSSLAGYSPWGCKEWDMTEWLTITIITKRVWSQTIWFVRRQLYPRNCASEKSRPGRCLRQMNGGTNLVTALGLMIWRTRMSEWVMR